MSKFFEDVGEVIASPFKTVYNLVTDNPKGNGLGDIWNNTVGPGNPIQQLVSDSPITQGLKSWTGADLSAPFSAPTFQDLGKPAQAFSGQVDKFNQVLPSFAQPYAQPIESAVLSAFNPLVGAAYNTAYQAGQNQAQPGAFDWGAFGKDAAINFGTAGVQLGATKLLSNANAAQAFKASPGSVTSAGNAAIGSNISSALDPFGSLGASAATPGFAATSAANLASNSASALGGVGAIPGLISAAQGPETAGNALRSFGTPDQTPSLGSSASVLPQAQALQSSGIGDAAYKLALDKAPGLVNQGLAATLAPTQNQPIAGALDSFGGGTAASTYQPGWGDVLNAFGGSEVTTPNTSGNRIDQAALDAMGQRLAANTYLQQSQARDSAIPAGQYEAPLNTPYANRLNEINSGANQSYKDLIDQVNNANSYYGLIDSNPGLTSDQLDTYITNPDSIDQVKNSNRYYSLLNQNPGLTGDQLDAYLKDPSSGVLGQFSVSPDQQSVFNGLTAPTYPNSFFSPGQIMPVPSDFSQLNGIRTLGPQNVSLLH